MRRLAAFVQAARRRFYESSKEDAVMSTKHWGFATVAILAVALWFVPNPRSKADEGPALEQGQEVLTHGPVHEAFAEPTVANPAPSLVVPKQPPDPIEEMPPGVKPDG